MNPDQKALVMTYLACIESRIKSMKRHCMEDDKNAVSNDFDRAMRYTENLSNLIENISKEEATK